MAPQVVVGRQLSRCGEIVAGLEAAGFMENLSFDTIEYAIGRATEREQAQRNIHVCNDRLAACGGEPLPTFAQAIRTCFVELDFEALPLSSP